MLPYYPTTGKGERAVQERNRLWAFGIIGFLSLLSVAAYLENRFYIYLVAYLWLGFIYGIALQYGRFCFSSAFRDLFAVGVPRMAVGMCVAMVLFALVSALVTAAGYSTFHAAPWGVHAVVGGLVFGIGMVFTGGCASGSLYKAGEGNGVAFVVLLSISVTQALFADVGGWFNRLVPPAWTASALQKGLPDAINVADGWSDQYLAGHVWDRPVATYAQLLHLSNPYAGAFLGNFLVGVLVPSALLLLLVYRIWVREGFHKQRRGQAGRTTLRDDLAGYWGMLLASRRTAIAGLILGVAAGLHMFIMKGLQVKFGVVNFGELMQRMGMTYGLSVQGTVFDPGYWYVTTQEAQWVGWLIHRLGLANMLDNIYFGYNNGIPNPLMNPPDWMTIATILGASVMALLAGEFKWKKPTWETASWAILGGALMGIGSRLALGCNIGAFFVRVAQGDVSGWFFGLGMIPGAYVGVRIFQWYTDRKMERQMAACDL